MDIIINGLRTAYNSSGTGPAVLLLHGWDMDGGSLEALRCFLSHHCHAVSLDMPGWGESDAPDHPWDLDEYAAFLIAFIEEVCPGRPLILAQDIAGRIALKLAAAGIASRLVLVNTPCQGLSFDAKFERRVKAYNFRRKLAKLPMTASARAKLLSRWPHWDPAVVFSRSSPMMREGLQLCACSDLTPLLPEIEAEVLLVYGDMDEAGSFLQAELMQEGLRNSGLVVMDGCGHIPCEQQPSRFIAMADYYIRRSGTGS